MPSVLVTNDDGIEAPGLKALVKSLSKEGFRVYVVAPRHPSSGTGKSVRFDHAKYFEVNYSGAHRAWWVDSTPATCVYVALNSLLPEPPDVVVSGINRGPNMGFEDFLTSGTIGAAIESSLHGVFSLAVSLATDSGFSEDEYRIAARVSALLVKAVLISASRSFDMLNVNVPVKPIGVRVTRLAWNNYKIALKNEGSIVKPVNRGFKDRYWDVAEGSDVWAVLNGYISITPVSLRTMAKVAATGDSLREAEELIKPLLRLDTFSSL
ncbi:MAG: 5'/3'-nucleotidase SurE [Desulfurococcales archaeon]|nr:5'/3'-nucleotidase SurE [Desulfurococcales archaeon]